MCERSNAEGNVVHIISSFHRYALCIHALHHLHRRDGLAGPRLVGQRVDNGHIPRLGRRTMLLVLLHFLDAVEDLLEERMILLQPTELRHTFLGCLAAHDLGELDGLFITLNVLEA